MASAPSVVVLDYGSGNVHSAAKALEAAGARVELTADRDRVAAADGLVVPGVGAFAAVMAGLFLGWLSYKNGTIWLGLVLHCTVAFSMDILALHHKGLLF